MAGQNGRWTHQAPTDRQPVICGPSHPPADEFFDRTASFGRTSQLNVYLKKRPAKSGVNLLSGKNSTGACCPRGRPCSGWQHHPAGLQLGRCSEHQWQQQPVPASSGVRRAMLMHPVSPPLPCSDGEALPDDVALKNETVIISYLKPNVTVQMIDDFRFVACSVARECRRASWVAGQACFWPLSAAQSAHSSAGRKLASAPCPSLSAAATTRRRCPRSTRWVGRTGGSRLCAKGAAP